MYPGQDPQGLEQYPVKHWLLPMARANFSQELASRYPDVQVLTRPYPSCGDNAFHD